MAKDGHKFWIICPECQGKGFSYKWIADEVGQGGLQEVICPQCGGIKYIFGGWIADELKNMPNGLPGGSD